MSNANRGQALEDLLAWQHNVYESRRVAWVRKFPTPVTIIRRDGEIVGAKPTGYAVADFMGWLYTGGRALAVEAKECRGNRFDLARIEPQQRDCLSACLDAGGVAAVMLWWTDHDELWALPWDLLRGTIGVGTKAFYWAQDSTFRVRGGTGPADYLKVLGVVA